MINVDKNGLTITNIFDDIHQDDSSNKLGEGNTTIKKSGCVLTAYVRMAQRLGADVSLDKANKMANKLHLYTNKDELSPENGAKLVNSLLVDSEIYDVKIKYHSTVSDGTTTDFTNAVKEKSDSSDFFFATARIHTSNKDFSQFYDHTLNVNDSTFFAPGPLDNIQGYKDPIFGIDLKGFNNIFGFSFSDTSLANRKSTHDSSRYMKINKVDFFQITPVSGAPSSKQKEQKQNKKGE